MAFQNQNFQKIQQFARAGASIIEIWDFIFRCSKRQQAWKEYFEQEDNDLKVWRFLLHQNRQKYLVELSELLEKEPLTIRWQELLPLLPVSVQSSILFLRGETEGYAFSHVFKKPL